jgi:hypothetical protein
MSIKDNRPSRFSSIVVPVAIERPEDGRNDSWAARPEGISFGGYGLDTYVR